MHVAHATALEREGQIARVERLHAEVARSDAERQLRASDHDVALARTALASLLAADSGIDPASGLFLSSEVGPLEGFIERAMENHPGLARLGAQRGRAAQAVRAEKAAWLPTVAAFGMRELHTEDLNIVSPTWAVGVAATFTLFDGMERGHRTAAARSQQARVDLLDARARRDIATLVEQRYRTMTKAREDSASRDRTRELAAELLRVRQRAVDEGMGTSLEVVDAQLALQGVQLQRLAAAYAFDVALAELLEATGDADQFVTHLAHADLDPEK
jgi:outer membrane protein TolC